MATPFKRLPFKQRKRCLIPLANMVPFIVLSLVSLLSTCFASSLDSDFHALVTLKKGEFSDSILNTWNYSSPSTVCSWAGIQCSSRRVVSVDLIGLNLSGFVSPQISKLDQLTNISLASNQFIGTLEIANLSSLRWLNISSNHFYGSLDWNYSSIANLEVFSAFDNKFTAFLPLGIMTLKKLKFLDLGNNHFFGRIPEIYANLVGLEYLSLVSNDLNGKIPYELGNLTNLRNIRLDFNNFEGGIPKEFGNLVNLAQMTLYFCKLGGPIPKQLGNLTNLVHLALSFNAFTGEIPFEFCNLKQLKHLELSSNNLHGFIPDCLADFPNLETLQLPRNNFTGMIPENMGQNGKLQFLELFSNKLTGTIPRNLCFSNKLRKLNLFKNFLSGPIPEGLGTCSSLTIVSLRDNYLNGSIPNGFLYLPKLNVLELQNNYLSGTLPENANSSSELVKLDQLDLSNNRLSGPLPHSFSNFSFIKFLLLGGNHFSGPIPSSIGEHLKIVMLDLSRNSLSGSIPPEIGNLYHLTYLDLSHNNLSGSIPPEISNIRLLTYLNFSRNHLNQTIPTSIGTIQNLVIADFSFNNLSGKLPEFSQFYWFKASYFAGNPNLCSALLNNSCDFTPGKGGYKSDPAHFKLIVIVNILIAFLVFAVAAAIIMVELLKRKRLDSWKMTAFQKLEFKVSHILKCVKDDNVIGRGGAGIVYYGKVPDGVEIAVKKLLGFGSDSPDHGFQAEIQTLGKIRHRNIVRFLAFCSNNETNLLVYEYMRNGNLSEALHGKKSVVLDWKLRYKVAIEVARGLCYLHHDCLPLIIHRDVKSNNILLDSRFEAQLADFGLSKFLINNCKSECMPAIAGSYGYIAPEYTYTLKVDEKSDVYSFGVVLLELLTGRRPVGDFCEGDDIVQWTKRVTKCCKEEVMDIVHPSLKPVPKDEAMQLLFVALLCVQEKSVKRPTMRVVVEMLSEIPYWSLNEQSSPSSFVHIEAELSDTKESTSSSTSTLSTTKKFGEIEEIKD